MSAAYFKAAIPEPYRILGLKLRPLSIGHYLLMRRFGCAFVEEGDAVATREDLLLGVLICSMEYGQFLEFVESEGFEDELQAWGESVGVFDATEKSKLFQQYIEAGQQEPKFWLEDRDDTKPSGGHWSQSILTVLTGDLGYSWHEAINCPLTQALADFYKHAERQGIVRLLTEEECAAVGEEVTLGAA